MSSVLKLSKLPPTQTASINGGNLEYSIAGGGRPVIVLIAGSGGPIDSWFRVHEQLAELGTVFAYNRCGVGASEAARTAQTGERVVGALRTLLIDAGLVPPYVLVGHSLGGLFANLFARSFPDEVEGVVLLDAAAPQDVLDLPKHAGSLQRWLQKASDAIARPNELDETQHVATTVEQINNAPPFPHVPLVVVTGGKPAMSWLTPSAALEARARHQRALAALSPRGRQVIARASGHFPQFTQPDIVVDAVRNVIAAIEGGRSVEK